MSNWLVSSTKVFLNELLNIPRDVSKRIPGLIEILEKDPIFAGGNAEEIKAYENNIYCLDVGQNYRLIYSFGKGWIKLLSIRKLSQYQEAIINFEIPNPDLVDSSTDPIKLSAKLTRSQLEQWQIPQEYWPILLNIENAESLLDLPIPDEFIHRILDILFPRSFPEIATQPEYILRKSEDLNSFVDGNLINFLLKLGPEQEKLRHLKSNGTILIKGGPGTGKSTLALYRVEKLVNLGHKPILFTTYTNTLVNYSEQLLAQLLEKIPLDLGVEVNTVDALAYRYYSEVYGKPKIATETQCLGCLETAIANTNFDELDRSDRQYCQQKIQQLGLSYILQEILDVIESRELLKLEEYLPPFERRGRLIPLRTNIRKAIWSIYQTWQQRMFHNGYISWEQLRREALKIAKELPEKPYQAVIIDEAQDLSPVSLRFLLALVPSLQTVYLTADASQSVYQRGFSWKQIDTDLKVTSRRILQHNYRNTQQISNACASILQNTEAGDGECLIQATFAYQGNIPTLLLVDNWEQQAQAIKDFFCAAAKQFRLPLHGSAVLCPSQPIGQKIAESLKNKGIKAEFISRKIININQPNIKILTIHSAKGLEFPFVAVVGLNEGILPYIHPNLPKDERPMAIAQQRRLFYVACSRAMRALMVCGSKSRPSIFLQNLSSPHWQRQEM